MSGHAIHPIPLFKAENVPPFLMTYMMGALPPHNMGFYVWYIEGPEKKILVDAGSTMEVLDLWFQLVAAGATGTEIQSLEEGLSKVGLKPEDIDIVILTQLHPDHVEQAGKFTNAKFIIQKTELDFALNPHPSAVLFFEKELFEGLDFEVVKGDDEIVDGVKILYTPGHSPGGQSVAVETNSGTAVITGFCCVRQNFEPPEMLAEMAPILMPGMFLDAPQLFDSMIKVKEAADIIVPLHEYEYVNADRIS